MFQEHVLDLVQLSAWQEYNDDQGHHCHIVILIVIVIVILVVIIIISIIPIPIPITLNLPPPFLIPFASTSSHLI